MKKNDETMYDLLKELDLIEKTEQTVESLKEEKIRIERLERAEIVKEALLGAHHFMKDYWDSIALIRPDHTNKETVGKSIPEIQWKLAMMMLEAMKIRKE
jgi:hypothetical protein